MLLIAGLSLVRVLRSADLPDSIEYLYCRFQYLQLPGKDSKNLTDLFDYRHVAVVVAVVVDGPAVVTAVVAARPEILLVVEVPYTFSAVLVPRLQSSFYVSLDDLDFLPLHIALISVLFLV